MNLNRSLLIAVALFFCGFASAQQDYVLHLEMGDYTLQENIKTYPQEATLSAREVINDRYYRLLQFFELPDQQMQETLKKQDIQLLEYLSSGTYIVSLPTHYDLFRLEGLQVRTIQEISNEMKITSSLQSFNYRDLMPDREVMLMYHKDISQANVRAFCKHDGIEPLEYNDYNNVMLVRLGNQSLQEIAELPYVLFIDEVPGPAIPDDTGGRSLHRANAIDVEFAMGRHYDGTGVNVLTRDDGAIGPHIDFHGRLDQSSSGPSRGNHGDGVSGIFAGAGNLDPRHKGMASGAMLYVIDYRSNFLDETMDLFFDNDVIVTNSSYSDGCNRGYSTITQTVDRQIYDNPTLLHVFSAGNSNNQECGYGAGDQWGNITGGHKQAKNCIATANLLSDGELVATSSRGPAHDGRIKPDISAHGRNQISTDSDNSYFFFGGTSAAAPGIAGVTAMLHQAYSELNNGERANSALLKAIMLNTANDLGRKGPDFRFGWGHVNALRAVQTMEENRHFMASVEPGGTATHTIDIPAGVREARVMVYWPDPPANPNVTKALINDIDISLQNAGDTYLPWVLDPTPDPITLNAPATKGVDNLNNMEQVAIDDPQAGTYTLEVKGSELPFGEHSYYVVWEFRTDDITLIYPNGGEKLEPGEIFKFHWDAEEGTQPFALHYSLDGGNTWTLITGVNANDRLYDWTTPNALTSNALFRVSRGGIEDVSDAPIHIAPVPENVRVESVCLDYLEVEWTALNGAIGYEVFRLGEKYMEVVASVDTNYAQIPISSPEEFAWVAVNAKYADGVIGQRSLAVSSPQKLFNCLIPHNVTMTSLDNPGDASVFYSCEDYVGPIEIQVTNNGQMAEDNITVGYRLDGGPAVIETIPQSLASEETFTYAFNEQPLITQSSTHDFLVWASVAGELYAIDDTISRTITIYTGDGVVPTVEDNFEGPIFPKQFWGIQNGDDDVTWTLVDEFGIIGPGGSVTNTIAMPFRNYDNRGAEDRLTTVPIDFSQITDSIYLTFDYAYARNTSDNDGLRVDVSTDCGATYNRIIFEKFGTDLVTATAAAEFAPTFANQWDKAILSLSEFIGESTVIVRFTGINDSGNNLFLDNINIREGQIAAPQANFFVPSNEVCLFSSLTFIDQSAGQFLTHEWDFGLGAMPNSATGPGPFTVTYQLPRPTEASLIVSNSIGADTIIQTINVVRNPTGDYNFVDDEGTVTFTSTGNAAYSHSWNFGDGNTSNEINPSHNYALPGDYNVVLTISNSCGDHVVEKTISIVSVGLFDPNDQQSVQILPNPNNGQFDLLLQSATTHQLTIRLFDTNGRLIDRKEIIVGVGETNVAFNKEQLPSGLYFLQLSDAKQTRSLKLIVE